jgi:hypothetical protein
LKGLVSGLLTAAAVFAAQQAGAQQESHEEHLHQFPNRQPCCPVKTCIGKWATTSARP